MKIARITTALLISIASLGAAIANERVVHQLNTPLNSNANLDLLRIKKSEHDSYLRAAGIPADVEVFVSRGPGENGMPTDVSYIEPKAIHVAFSAFASRYTFLESIKELNAARVAKFEASK